MVREKNTKQGAGYRWSGLLVVVLVMAKLDEGAGQECTTYASTLYACFPYVQQGNSTQVGADCCTPLQDVVKTRPDCVCTLQNLSATVPNVNVTRANQLNTLCNIKSTATLASCNGTSAPAPAPALTDKNGAYPPQNICILQVIFIGLALLFLNFN
ncbi:hypothetical protein GOP47_0026270 [Adiantum capillus-veneris]|nr:hypothetical protein GOP47_0026270 [Adiantum capillus-veneris]